MGRGDRECAAGVSRRIEDETVGWPCIVPAMMTPSLLRFWRKLTGWRDHARAAKRLTQEQKDLQRRQAMAMQLTDMLKANRRDPPAGG